MEGINAENFIPRPRTSFFKVKCPACGNEQTIFGAASRSVKCLGCSNELAKSGASKISTKSKIIKEFK